MTSARLERHCRRLLLAYPRDYRSQRGDELLATLVDVTGPDRRYPRLADAVDVVATGLWRRVGTGSRAGLESGLATVAPVGLAIAAGISLFAWWQIEPLGSRTAGPVGYAAWLLAAGGWLWPRPAPRRALIGLAIATTLLLPAIASALSIDRPPLWVLMALSAFGVLALAGSAPAIGRPDRPPVDERLAVPAGAAAIAACSVAVTAIWPAPSARDYYYQPTIARVGLVVAVAVAALAGFALIRVLRGGNARPWLWATVLLGLPAGWFGPFDSNRLDLAADRPVPEFGRLAQVLLASSLVVIVMTGLGRRVPDRSARRAPGRDTLPTVGWGVLGCATGLAGFTAAGWAGLIGFTGPTGPTAVPRHILVTLSALAIAGTWAIAVRDRRRTPGVRPDRREATGRPVIAVAMAGGTGLVTAVGTAIVAWVVASYDNNWSTGGWPDVAHSSGLAMTLAFVPFTAAVIGAVGVLSGYRAGSRVAAAGVAVVSVGWMGYVAVPYLVLWGPLLLIILAGVVALALSARRGLSASGARR